LKFYLFKLGVRCDIILLIALGPSVYFTTSTMSRSILPAMITVTVAGRTVQMVIAFVDYIVGSCFLVAVFNSFTRLIS
jgi:hypothetical protein